MKKRCSKEQSIGFLMQADAGVPLNDLSDAEAPPLC